MLIALNNQEFLCVENIFFVGVNKSVLNDFSWNSIAVDIFSHSTLKLNFSLVFFTALGFFNRLFDVIMSWI